MLEILKVSDKFNIKNSKDIVDDLLTINWIENDNLFVSENLFNSQKTFFIDTLYFTLHTSTEDINDIISISSILLSVDSSTLYDGYQVSGAIYGYNQKKQIRFSNGLIVLYGGQEKQGINFLFNGKCLQSILVHTILKNLYTNLDYTFKITRADFAVDTTEIPFSWFYNKFTKREYLSLSQFSNNTKYVNGDNQGTLYFGKRRKCECFIRIYDKGLEQKLLPNLWTRVEFECTGDFAPFIIDLFIDNCLQISDYFNKKLCFYQRRVSNMSRDGEQSKKWLKLISGSGQKVSMLRCDKSDSQYWIENSVAPTLKYFVTKYGQEWLDNLLDNTKISQNILQKQSNIELVKKQESENMDNLIAKYDNVTKFDRNSSDNVLNKAKKTKYNQISIDVAE